MEKRFFFFRMKSVLITILMATAAALPAQARYACELVFQTQTASTRKLVEEDAYHQWLLWEQRANFAPFTKPTEPFQIPVVYVRKDRVTVESESEAPKNFLKFILERPNVVKWFQHPYNMSPIVPFAHYLPKASIEGYYTASRSIALGGEFRGLSIKMGTDHPHGPFGQRQSGKAETADDIRSALLHSRHLKKIDKELGLDSELLMMPEVITVAENKTSHGYVIRDIRAMDSGHYYLPALSIPYVGRQIAHHNKQSFESFWKKHFAEVLGRTKAKLLLRYGLQIETPNAQNMLIQLDRNLKPTGRIVYRDISDAYFVDVVGQGLGFEKQMQKDLEATYEPRKFMKPFWSNSSWRFDEAGDLSVSHNTLTEWGLAHNTAYRNYLAQELKMNLPDFSAQKRNYDPNLQKVRATVPDDAVEIYQALNTPEGQQALQSYAKRRTLKRRPN